MTSREPQQRPPAGDFGFEAAEATLQVRSRWALYPAPRPVTEPPKRLYPRVGSVEGRSYRQDDLAAVHSWLDKKLGAASKAAAR